MSTTSGVTLTAPMDVEAALPDAATVQYTGDGPERFRLTQFPSWTGGKQVRTAIFAIEGPGPSSRVAIRCGCGVDLGGVIWWESGHVAVERAWRLPESRRAPADMRGTRQVAIDPHTRQLYITYYALDGRRVLERRELASLDVRDTVDEFRCTGCRAVHHPHRTHLIGMARKHLGEGVVYLSASRPVARSGTSIARPSRGRSRSG